MQNVTINGIRYGQVFGSTMPGPIWRESMEAALANKDALPFDLQTPIFINTGPAPTPSALPSDLLIDPSAVPSALDPAVDPAASPAPSVVGAPPAASPAPAAPTPAAPTPGAPAPSATPTR
jgi:hypothetical protein